MLDPVSIRHRTITSHAVGLTCLTDKANDNDSHPHIDWTKAPLTILIGLLMCAGLSICSRLRSCGKWRVPGLFGQDNHWKSSALPTLLPSWAAKPLPMGYDGRHWTNYESISEGMVAPEPTLGSEPRWLSRAQPTALRHRSNHRRPSRRYRYPERSYQVPAGGITHRSSNIPSYWNTSRQEIKQAVSLGKRTIGQISGDSCKNQGPKFDGALAVPYADYYSR
jgi:hypothetical protein